MTDDLKARGVRELLPCPFCGGVVEIERGSNAGAIQCVGSSSCLRTGLLIGFHLAQEDSAISAWNRRAALSDHPTVKALVAEAEALRAAIEQLQGPLTVAALVARAEIAEAERDTALADLAAAQAQIEALRGAAVTLRSVVVMEIPEMEQCMEVTDLDAALAALPVPNFSAGWPLEEGDGSIIVGAALPAKDS